MKQNNRYIKRNFDFGEITIAHFVEPGIIWICYWGKDGVYERIKLRDTDNKLIHAEFGGHHINGIERQSIGRVPDNLTRRIEEVKSIVPELREVDTEQHARMNKTYSLAA